MAVSKLSVSLEASVAEDVARAAEHAGMSVSAWINQAAANKLATGRGLDAVRAWEADHGALTQDELTAADALLDRIVASAPRAD